MVPSQEIVTSGVPQGCVIGPTLILLYADDINQVICEGVMIRKHAGNIKLFRAYGQQDNIAAHVAMQFSLGKNTASVRENSLPLNLLMPIELMVLRVTFS